MIKRCLRLLGPWERTCEGAHASVTKLLKRDGRAGVACQHRRLRDEERRIGKRAVRGPAAQDAVPILQGSECALSFGCDAERTPRDRDVVVATRQLPAQTDGQLTVAARAADVQSVARRNLTVACAQDG